MSHSLVHGALEPGAVSSLPGGCRGPSTCCILLCFPRCNHQQCGLLYKVCYFCGSRSLKGDAQRQARHWMLVTIHGTIIWINNWNDSQGKGNLGPGIMAQLANLPPSSARMQYEHQFVPHPFYFLSTSLIVA